METSVPFSGFALPEENWSRLPHAMIGAAPIFETKAEVLVVLYILRHTWGFGDEEKKITLDEFMNGRKRRNGTRIDNGIGMTKTSVIDGLRRAEEHGFIEVDVEDKDKARIEKFYRLRMSKNCTPDVQKLDTGGTETIPRSEKETSRKKPKKDSSTPDGVGGSRQRKRDELIDTLTTHLFKAKLTNRSKMALAGINAAWLRGTSTGTDKITVGINQYPSDNPQEVIDFVDWWNETKPNYDNPTGISSFAKWWREWCIAGKPKPNTGEPTRQREPDDPTPGEYFNQVAELRNKTLRRVPTGD